MIEQIKCAVKIVTVLDDSDGDSFFVSFDLHALELSLRIYSVAQVYSALIIRYRSKIR